MIDITVDARAVLGTLNSLSSQAPFAIALALNRTADDVQADERKHIADVFTLRRKPFIDRTVKIENANRATKTRPIVTVGIDPSRDVLAKFETDTSKASVTGRALAVPVDAPRTKPGDVGTDIIPRSLRIKQLDIQPGTVRDLKFKKDKRSGLHSVYATYRAPGHGLHHTFLVKTSHGTYILQRTGPAATDVRVLYVFRPRVPIKPVLDFERTARATVAARWVPNMEGAFAFAMQTAK